MIAEHDKERGTRQKIDEPKTPFAQDEPKELDLKVLEYKLGRIERGEESSEDSSEEETEEQREKRRLFEAKRKAHYNEVLLMKRGQDSDSSDED